MFHRHNMGGSDAPVIFPEHLPLQVVVGLCFGNDIGFLLLRVDPIYGSIPS